MVCAACPGARRAPERSPPAHAQSAAPSRTWLNPESPPAGRLAATQSSRNIPRCVAGAAKGLHGRPPPAGRWPSLQGAAGACTPRASFSGLMGGACRLATSDLRPKEAPVRWQLGQAPWCPCWSPSPWAGHVCDLVTACRLPGPRRSQAKSNRRRHERRRAACPRPRHGRAGGSGAQAVVHQEDEQEDQGEGWLSRH